MIAQNKSIFMNFNRTFNTVLIQHFICIFYDNILLYIFFVKVKMFFRCLLFLYFYLPFLRVDKFTLLFVNKTVYNNKLFSFSLVLLLYVYGEYTIFFPVLPPFPPWYSRLYIIVVVIISFSQSFHNTDEFRIVCKFV